MTLSALSWRRRALAALTVLAVTVSGLLLAAPAEAGNRVTPGNFTGYGFDQCNAPSQTAMDAWLTSSPYFAVGIYIAGKSRYCKEQPNLTPEWVSTQLRSGWRLLPITVGRQASCTTVDRYRTNRISSDPTGGYKKAREQGKAEATVTVKAAQGLGISPKSTLWYDIEHFDIGIRRCRLSALAFLSSWTDRLHELDYVSGVYSSGSSGIAMLDAADRDFPDRWTMPDRLWIADWNGRDDVSSSYVRPTAWMPHARVHQYRGDHYEKHGGVSIQIDSNFLDVGRGSTVRRKPRTCGVQMDFPRYGFLRLGSEWPQVSALQCLLRQKRLYDAPITGTFDRVTQKAVRDYQRSRSLEVTGKVARNTWTSLLSEGTKPVLKYGSAGNPVRRVQRALNAALGSGLAVTGVFEAETTAALREYQGRRNLYRTGVVAEGTWAQLVAGRL